MSGSSHAMRVKICGLTRPADARVAAEAGADVVGAVLVASSPRAVSPGRAAEIGEAAQRPLALVVADVPAARIVEAARRARASVLQLHGDEPPELLRVLAGEGDWELWKAARVRSLDEIERAVARYHGVARALLLDGWHPDQLGGTGTRFPWEALEALRGRIPADLEVGVAGGLEPGNVATAVTRLRPDIVDVSSGVEIRPGIKEAGLVAAFVERARTAAGKAAEDTSRDHIDSPNQPHQADGTEAP